MINVHVKAQTLNIANPANVSQNIISIVIPEEYILIDSNSSTNAVNFTVTSVAGANIANINVPTVNVTVSSNLTTNISTLTITDTANPNLIFNFDIPYFENLISLIEQAIANGNAAVLNTLLSELEAARLLNRATFGATLNSINAASNTATAQTYAQWFATQFSQPTSSIVNVAHSTASVNVGNNITSAWTTNAVIGPDELRQRIAYALLQIFVVASTAAAGFDPLMYYYDMLAENAFGTFRNLLEKITYSVEMGKYLSTFQNAAAGSAFNPSGEADENYAREIQQLFSIGLIMLNANGSPQLDANGNFINTYDQTEIKQMAKVFTGLASNNTTQAYGISSWQYDYDYTVPMIVYDAYHDNTSKTILSGVVLAANQNTATDIGMTLDTICNHQNVGPFLGSQLIKKLVISNPSPQYISNVSAVWANDGNGVRGNLSAVYVSIFTDQEALNLTGTSIPTYGKLIEPLVRTVHHWRAMKGRNWVYGANGANLVSSQFQLPQPFDIAYGQEVGYSPSVFNFYPPNYIKPGRLANANLIAPEFGIVNEYTIAATASELLFQSSDWMNSANTGNNNLGQSGYPTSNNFVLSNSSDWITYTSNVSNLIDQLNIVYMSGTMSSNMKNILMTFANTTPANANSNPGQLVIDLSSLILISPEYSILK